MRLYADSAAYAAYYPDQTPPENVDALLRAASRVVDHLLRGYLYDTVDSMPTDADDITAMSDATVVIAAEMAARHTLSPGTTNTWDQVAIGTVKLAKQSPADEGTGVEVNGLPIPLDALMALQNVGKGLRTTLGFAGLYRRNAWPWDWPLDQVTH